MNLTKRSLLAGFVALALVTAVGAAGASKGPDAVRGSAVLGNVHRIVFLGDSITQGGDYVADFECWLLSQGLSIEVLNLGLGSETATELTAAENQGHKDKFGFVRPWIGERLDRALAATKPDLVIACYGMNDGGSLPADETGTKRFAEATIRLRDAALRAGARHVVLCSAPVRDTKGDPKTNVADQNLQRYAAWLMSKRADGWDVVDIHTPMRKALDEARAKNPAFIFAKDGVHPGREGHWLMMHELVSQYFGANLDGKTRAEDLFSAHGDEIRKLVCERKGLLFSAWMTQIGHTRPGVPGGPGVKPGPKVAEAEAKAAELTKKIGQLMPDAKP